MLMNKIEKMYENAGVQLRCGSWCRTLEIPSTLICGGICSDEKLCSKCRYGHIKHKYYPLFTAEKQLELIKWLSKYCMTIDCIDGEYEVYTGYDDIIDDFYDKLEDAIVHCVNTLWQDLTSEEKQQIKEILERE